MGSSKAVRRIGRDLKKCMREPECLYSIGPEITSGGSISQVLTNRARRPVKGVRFPEIAFPSIRPDGREYSASSFPEEEIAGSLPHTPGPWGDIRQRKRGAAPRKHGAPRKSRRRR